VAEPASLTCANCSTTIPERDAEAAGWRYWSDGVGELLPFCPVCAEREFASDAPAERTSTWLLACGHDAPMLKHEHAGSPPLRRECAPSAGDPGT